MKYLNPETWLTERKNYIGASDISALCPELVYNPDFTALLLYKEKRGEYEREIDDNLQNLFDAGHEQENITIYRFLKKFDPDYANIVREHHLKNEIIKDIKHIDILTEFTIDNMICHPDLLWKKYNVECKFVKHKGREWNFYYAKEGKEFGSEDDIPIKYWLQCQFQMLLSGKKETILCANYQGLDFYYFKFKADDLTQHVIKKKCSDFWNLVKNGTPPMPLTRADAKLLFPKRNDKSMTLGNETESEQELLLTIQLQKDRKSTLKEKIKTLEDEVKKIDAVILSLMVNYNVIYDQFGNKIASISEWETERVKALSEIKENKKIYNYLIKNDLIVKSNVSRLNF